MKMTKNFNLEIYELEQKAKTFLLILIVFIFGFLLGYLCKNTVYEDRIYRQSIEIVDLKDQVDRERYYKTLKEKENDSSRSNNNSKRICSK